MAVYAEDFGHQRCGRRIACCRLPREFGGAWQIDEAGGADFTDSTTTGGFAAPGPTASSTRLQYTSLAHVTSGKGETRSAAFSQGAKAFNGTGSQRLFSSDSFEDAERA